MRHRVVTSSILAAVLAAGVPAAVPAVAAGQAAPAPGAASRATGAPAPPRPELRTFLDSLDRAIPRHLHEFRIPGAAVALIEDGRVVLLRGYGYADAAHRRPVTTRTAFNVGSVSKAVTAWGVMRLVQEGRLALDAPVDRSLTRWHLPPSPYDASGVTVRRLLSHTAGLSVPGYRGWWEPGELLPTLEASLAGRNNGAGPVQLVAAPGAKWDYSGGGYTVLQLLIEEITRRPFADYLRDAVLRPLGMRHSAFVPDAEGCAAAARPVDELGEEIPSPRFTEQAAAGLYTTAEDLTRFALALLPGVAGDTVARPVLRPATVDTMLAPALGTDGSWALGHAVEAYPDGQTRVGHGGGNRGWQANVWVGRAGRDGLVVLTGATDGWNLINQVVAEWMTWKSGRPRPIRKSVAAALLNALHDDGAPAAVARYATLKATQADAYLFDEGELNRLGYALLHKGRARDAVALFGLNAREYANAWNPHDSLGDAYAAAGDMAAAVASYTRSLALNPKNANAQRMLDRLSRR